MKENDSMKRTILFTAALATAAAMFVLNAAQAAGPTDKGQAQSQNQNSGGPAYLPAGLTGDDAAQRNRYSERNEYREGDDEGYGEGYRERGEIRTQMRVAPDSEWLAPAEVITKLEGQGYTIRELERKRYGYEVKMTDRNGLRVEAYLEPTTAEPLPGMAAMDD
jgi:hypothetical protein